MSASDVEIGCAGAHVFNKLPTGADIVGHEIAESLISAFEILNADLV